ncbi:MAG: tRNA guanosine(15) transglycosylase TgtA [Nitrososphaera sp.]|uniref:tRNA guanosine(15) transglycosylase TgtA n=1 Tax=Candidatus Nitrososphaera gargensis TaxID=497727 RepID=UPI0011E4EFF4|nr:tRNA guanosine(15) transglycosylase TgtA [Candidatus Nitrososphaera gargensis]
MFEVRYSDLAARVGRLETPHGVVETPAFVPVVHPVRQTVSTQFLKKMGFGIVITNAYITLRHYGDEARRRGIHDIIGYDGAVMTDSGGYQVLEYGSVEVEPAAMAQFEKDIRSDIPIPLDKPTGYGLDYERAKEYVATTLKNSQETLDVVGNTDAIWVGPVQGAEHSDLVEHSARELGRMGFKLMALGSPVELMEAYEFATLARMIVAAKKVIPAKPVHLFGAGHPLTIPLAVALGCDMFDSASYMLYAKDGRYMTPNGTVRLDELVYLPCQCPVCSSHSLQELRGMNGDERVIEVAKHNLHVLKAEVDAVKQAIMDGRLWEYVMQKARAHPKLMEAVQLFKDIEMLESGTPLFKERAIFFYDPIDQHRPEAKRFRRAAAGFQSSKKKLVLCPEGEVHPFYSTRSYREIVKRLPDAQVCSYSPFLGIIPAEISDIFPAAHNLATRYGHRPEDYPTFIESLKEFVKKFEQVTIIADDFMEQAAKAARLNARLVNDISAL